MKALHTALRWIVGTCLSLVLLYCGAAMIMSLVLKRELPAFPFSWVNWLNRPGIPLVADHVINFLLASMVATLLKDMWRKKDLSSRARSNEHI